MKPAKRQSKALTYYRISSDFTRGGPPGWKFLNYDTLQKDHSGITPSDGWPDGYLQLPRGPWRFPDYVDTPRFLIDRKLGRPPRDLEDIDGIWIISAAMKAVLETIDPTACEFRRCETFLVSNVPGPETWLCSVTRAFVGAVDPEASEYLDVTVGCDRLPLYGASPLTVCSLSLKSLEMPIYSTLPKWRGRSIAISSCGTHVKPLA